MHIINKFLFKAGDVEKKNSKSGLIEIHAAVFLFGFSGLFGKFLHCPSIVIVLGRTWFAAAALLPMIFLSGMRPFSGGKKSILIYAAQGILLAAHWTCFFYSIQISTVTIGLLTFSTFPVFVTFMEPVFFREKLYFSDVAAAFIVFAGLVLVLPGFDFSKAPVKGAFWGVVSGLTFAVLSIVNRKNVENDHPAAVAFHQNFFAGLALVPFAFILNPPVPGANELILLAALGIVCTAFSHTLFIKSLMFIKAKTAGIITALEPLYGILLAFVILGERPGLRMIAGGLIIIGATVYAGFVRGKALQI